MLSLPPLSLYIHFPWCVKKCPYCDFNSHVLKKDLPEKEYIQALLKELESFKKHIKNRSITSIYLGGGTPSLFSGHSIAYLFEQINANSEVAKNAEITIEANPESVELNKLISYRKAGINRISLGIQSLNDSHLQKLGRAHNSQGAFEAITKVQKAGFTNFNLDLMYGLPNQTEQEGIEDLQKALAFSPNHLSWYQLTLEPNTAFYKKPPILPCEDSIVDLQLKGNNLLKQAGFKPYEISAWNRSSYECCHNNNYWTFGDYIGLGAGAHSKVTWPRQAMIMRYTNPSSPRIYLTQCGSNKEAKPIDSKELLFEFMLNYLRQYRPLQRNLFETRTGLTWSVLQPYCAKGAAKGFLEWNEHSLKVTSLGSRFYNDLVALFLV